MSRHKKLTLSDQVFSFS